MLRAYFHASKLQLIHQLPQRVPQRDKSLMKVQIANEQRLRLNDALPTTHPSARNTICNHVRLRSATHQCVITPSRFLVLKPRVQAALISDPQALKIDAKKL